ncbi:hypothetical protein [Tautonia rosea]|uniref:hypothetical protein n=1 Tax=Tautonia rosea TaxID=2728037 RepID=UPI0014751142|nr:hypothetical protein [Tautonia rosea]
MEPLRSPRNRKEWIDEINSVPVTTNERLGPILSGLGLVGWVLVGLILRLIWSSYDQATDILLLQLVTSSLASVLVLFAGGAASVTLSLVGGLICGTQLFVRHVVDHWTIIGVVTSMIGLSPIVILGLKLLGG